MDAASSQPPEDKNGNQLQQNVLDELVRLVKETDYDTTTIAKKLGINRATVYRRIRDLELYGQPYPPILKKLGRPLKNPPPVDPNIALPSPPNEPYTSEVRRIGYSCDVCRSRKAVCDRAKPHCLRCQTDGLDCQYTRSNALKRRRASTKPNKPASPAQEPRKRGRPRKNPEPAPVISPSAAHHEDSPTPAPTGATSELETHIPGIKQAASDTVVYEVPGSDQQHPLLSGDIEFARRQLKPNDVAHKSSLFALSSLAETSAAVWMHASEYVDRRNTKFFIFETEPSRWVDEVFAGTLNRGGPMMIKPPQHVLSNLRAGRPDLVQERAWLVTYYSIVLSMVSSTDPKNKTLKTKLRCNLWLAFNDVRLLLEPSEANIQALLLLAAHVEEFTTPALSWMLTTNACRMMQALGVNHRRLDAATRERRFMRFWHLSLLDQGMAVIFGRTPVFHRTTVRDMPRPTLVQMMDFQPHVSPAQSRGTFGPHFIHRMILLAPVMANIWSCLNEVPSPVTVQDALMELESWYSECNTILQAAATTEKPFLDDRAKASIDLGLNAVKSQYLYFNVLLTRTVPDLKTYGLDAAQQYLHLLDNLVSDSEEPYNGIIWQLICVPFTPFLTLFSEILDNKASRTNRDHLAAMACLPTFLRKMAIRNSLAGKLEKVATIIVDHAEALVEAECRGAEPPTIPEAALSMPNWDAFLNNAMALPATSSQEQPQFNLENWAYDFFSGDAMLDWIGWDTAGDITKT